MAHEFDGKKYEQASAHQREWGSRIISELQLQGDEWVLDLGCGDGSLSAQIADTLTTGMVFGIDASQGMIDAALPKERANLRFHKLDIGEISFVEEFDVVFSNATLHWVQEHRPLLRNVHRALRDGGRVRFNFAGEGNCGHFFAVVREAMSQDPFREFFTEFEWPWYMPAIGEYTALAESAGFRSVEVWEENADRYFPDAGAMARWVEQPSIVPFLPHLPEAHREPFRDYVVQRMTEQTIQEDGRCFETFRRINLRAAR